MKPKKVPHVPFPWKINPSWRIGIVFSSYYKEEISALVEGAKEELVKAGMKPSSITEWEAPGSFEIPLIGAALAEKKKVDALIGLGIIVEGGTHHARLLAENVARGIMETQLRYKIPFAFEVLYVQDLRQARKRLEKGREAAGAILLSLLQLQRIACERNVP